MQAARLLISSAFAGKSDKRFCRAGPSQRVNVYLPKSLIGQIDRRAADLGISRSSFIGLAATTALGMLPGARATREALAEPRSNIRKAGRLRTEA